MKGTSRVQRERERRQRDFLEAAEEVFAQKGFHSATIQEISGRTEFGAGSIYHMFENKDEIYLALLRMRREEYLSGLEERVNRAGDPVEKIRAFIENKFDFFSRHQKFLRIFLNTSFAARWNTRAGLADELIGEYEEYLAYLSGIFEEGAGKGLFSVNDPVAMALSIEGITNGFLSYWTQHEGEEVPGLSVSTVEEIFFRGVLKKGKGK